MTRTPLHMGGTEYRTDEYKGLVASGDHDVTIDVGLRWPLRRTQPGPARVDPLATRHHHGRQPR